MNLITLSVLKTAGTGPWLATLEIAGISGKQDIMITAEELEKLEAQVEEESVLFSRTTAVHWEFLEDWCFQWASETPVQTLIPYPVSR